MHVWVALYAQFKGKPKPLMEQIEGHNQAARRLCHERLCFAISGDNAFIVGFNREFECETICAMQNPLCCQNSYTCCSKDGESIR